MKRKLKYIKHPYSNIQKKFIIKNDEDYYKKIIKIYNKGIYDIFEKSWVPIVDSLKLKTKPPKINESYTTYHYESVNEIQDKLIESFDLRREVQYRDGNTEQDLVKVIRKVKYITEYYARGLKQYIQDNNYIDIKISNAYLKLWELLYIIPEIIPENDFEKEKLMVFHMAELPGQFIYSISRFLKVNRKDQYEYMNMIGGRIV
jgi:hypothetical protein